MPAWFAEDQHSSSNNIRALPIHAPQDPLYRRNQESLTVTAYLACPFFPTPRWYLEAFPAILPGLYAAGGAPPDRFVLPAAGCLRRVLLPTSINVRLLPREPWRSCFINPLKPNGRLGLYSVRGLP